MDSKIKRYTLSEVIEYVEWKMLEGISNQDEEIIYQDLKWDGKIDKYIHRDTLKKLVREMKIENGF